MFPKTSAYVKRYDWQTRWIYFFYTIWDKVSTDIKKEFDSKPVYQKKKKKFQKPK